MSDTEQQDLPGVGDAADDKGADDQGDDRLAAAEKRARDAERRARQAERAETQRKQDEARQKRDAELKDLDSAKAQLAEIEKREKEAQAKVAEYEDRERARIERMVSQLGDDAKTRAEKYREKLSLSDWSEFVEEELRTNGGKPGTVATPPATPSSQGRRNMRDDGNGRQLHPESERLLDELGQSTGAARQGIEVEKDGAFAKFVFPPKKLIKMMRERATQPQRLSQENYNKLFSE